jgi:hypothetical protein
MKNLNITVVEELLEGKISNNPDRFDCANGIVFSVNEMNEDIADYFNCYGVEFHELVNGIYYTETIMTVSEFSDLKYINNYKRIA